MCSSESLLRFRLQGRWPSNTYLLHFDVLMTHQKVDHFLVHHSLPLNTFLYHSSSIFTPSKVRPRFDKNLEFWSGNITTIDALFTFLTLTLRPRLVAVMWITKRCLLPWYAIVNHGTLESLQVFRKFSQTAVLTFNLLVKWRVGKMSKRERIFSFYKYGSYFMYDRE